MEPERLRQIEQLFHAALEVESNRRADFPPARKSCLKSFARPAPVATCRLT
jgi:hypothetical protein